MPDLMHKDSPTTVLNAEAENTVGMHIRVSPAAFVSIVDDQMHEVGPDLVAHRVHLVHVTVGRLRETVQIEESVARLGIPHLGLGHHG